MLQAYSAVGSRFSANMVTGIDSARKADVPLGKKVVSYICINNSGFVRK
jgi:hypothetical protein